jgi:hypothetical protein
MILEWILEKYGMKFGTAFMWIGSSGTLLWKL